MNMENFTSVFNSADGPTSIFVAGKTPEIMGVLIAIVVVGVIISLFGLKLVRVLSAMMGLGTGAVIGAVIGTVAGLDTTKMVATIAVCGVVLCIMCAVLRKFGIFVMTFFGSWGTFVTLVEARSVIVLGICAAVALVIAILTVIFAEFLVIFVTGIVGGVEAGMALPFLLGMTKIGWICNECSDRSNWHHGSDNDAVEKDRKEGKNIFEKDQRTGFDGIGSRKGQNASR